MPQIKRADRLAHAEQDARAAELWAQRRTYQEIADEMGYSSRAVAHKAVQRAFRNVLPMAAVREEVRAQLMQLDLMERVTMGVMARRHPIVSQRGDVVLGPPHPETGVREPLDDDGIRLQAVQTLIRLQERRTKLIGADAPTRTQVAVITVDAVDAAIAQLERDIAAKESALGQAAVAALTVSTHD